MTESTVDVLVAGGGLTGLAAATFLAWHGVRVTVVERHAGTLIHPRARSINPRTAELLRKLADNEFSLLARTPPLLYHNDLTASVHRFYWSEELGYALWLRLYFENERARSSLLCREGDAKQECAEK